MLDLLAAAKYSWISHFCCSAASSSVLKVIDVFLAQNLLCHGTYDVSVLLSCFINASPSFRRQTEMFVAQFVINILK